MGNNMIETSIANAFAMGSFDFGTVEAVEKETAGISKKDLAAELKATVDNLNKEDKYAETVEEVQEAAKDLDFVGVEVIKKSEPVNTSAAVDQHVQDETQEESEILGAFINLCNKDWLVSRVATVTFNADTNAQDVIHEFISKQSNRVKGAMVAYIMDTPGDDFEFSEIYIREGKVFRAATAQEEKEICGIQKNYLDDYGSFLLKDVGHLIKGNKNATSGGKKEETKMKENKKPVKDYTIGGRVQATNWNEMRKAAGTLGIKTGGKGYDALVAEVIALEKKVQDVADEKPADEKTAVHNRKPVEPQQQVQQEKKTEDVVVNKPEMMDIPAWEKLVLYGNGATVDGVLAIATSNINQNFISAWMLRSTIAEVFTGKRLKDAGKLAEFTVEEETRISKAQDAFVKKYLDVVTRDKEGNPRGYAFKKNRQWIAYMAVCNTFLTKGITKNYKAVIYRAVTGTVMPTDIRTGRRKMSKDISDRCMDVIKALMFYGVLGKMANGKTGYSKTNCLALLNMSVAELDKTAA